MEYYEDSDDENTDTRNLPGATSDRQTGRRKRQLYIDHRDDMSYPGTSRQKSLPSSSHDTKQQGFPRSYSSLTQHHKTSRQGFSHSRYSQSCPEFADAQNAVDDIYRNYTTCRRCNGSDILEVPDDDGKILVLQCASCSEPFGFDDTMSPDVLRDLHKQGAIEMQVGCCSNSNPDKFRILDFDGTNFTVHCEICKKTSTLSHLFPSQESEVFPQAGTSPDDHFQCQCGNEDQDKMMVSIVDDHRSVQCASCQRVLYEENAAFREITTGPNSPDKEHRRLDLSGNTGQQASGPLQLPDHQLAGRTPHIEPDKPEECSYDEAIREGYEVIKAPSKRKLAEPEESSGAVALRNARKLNSHAAKYREITKFSELHRGDHIKWDRTKGYSHHALIEHILEDQSRIVVLHYNGPDSATGRVARETFDPFENPLERLYLAEYTECFDTEEVIARAQSRLDEVKYNLALNNCEHFATWCKTGHHVSSQVMSVKDCFVKYAKVCSSNLRAVDLRNLSQNPPKQLGPKAAVLKMATSELKGYMSDVTKASQDLQKGHLSKEAYLEVVVSRTTRSIGGLAGMALGVCIPIPLVGEFIGGTVGGMIGEFTGRQVGKVLVRAYDEYGHLLKANKYLT